MVSDNKKILITFDNILSNKKFIKEASSSSDSFLGGNKVMAKSGGHAGQSGWQSANAWDIPSPVGTPVYALADGTAITFSDYGRNITNTNGKKLYGQSFTVDSDNNLPDIYYTHLERSTVSKGQKIKCGQLLGYVMDMPGSDFDHVHIGVERGDISQFLSPDGKILCGGGSSVGGGETNSVEDSYYDPATAMMFMKESIGKKTKTSMFGDELTLPAKENEKIYSPIEGVINNNVSLSNCQKNIIIELIDGEGYLEYCDVSDRRVRDKQQVNVGTLLGRTSDDVKVRFYGRNKSKRKISNSQFDNLPNKKKSDIESITKSDKPSFYDPLMAMPLMALSNAFSDKIDPETNKVEKRSSKNKSIFSTKITDGPVKPVDPWIKTALTKPFKKIGKVLGTNKDKNLEENIERIKNLLK